MPTFLEKVNIYFERRVVNIDLPVVLGATFELLLGNDVLSTLKADILLSQMTFTFAI